MRHRPFFFVWARCEQLSLGGKYLTGRRVVKTKGCYRKSSFFILDHINGAVLDGQLDLFLEE
jgi:hypothetical protein